MSRAAPGAVYTQPWAAELVLDLCGYVTSIDLTADLIEEPGCGDGAFLVAIVRRLLQSAETMRVPAEQLVDCIRAYDVDEEAIAVARQRVTRELEASGAPKEVVNRLLAVWIRQEDYLLATDLGPAARWVVGNPPYVPLTRVTSDVRMSYQQRWRSLSGRADLYVAFFEAGLSRLEPEGRLCFIAPDRWMHNQYGRRLRELVGAEYAVDVLIDAHTADLFADKVFAYPAIALLRRGPHLGTALATLESSFRSEDVGELRRALLHARQEERSGSAFTSWGTNADLRSVEGWPTGSRAERNELARIEARLPTLEDVGVRVRVGLATGSDRVFVVDRKVDVEPEFVHRAVGPADLMDGKVRWTGRHVVSPWIDRELADLRSYPRLQRYFTKHEAALKGRYVARRLPQAWWRTIDRPPAGAFTAPKVLLADLNDQIEPILDTEGFWPLHSLYYLTTSTWELDALAGYLLSDVASSFLTGYSVKMSSGHLRISAQYLRRLRIPQWSEVPQLVREDLAEAFRSHDRTRASDSVRALLH